MRVKLTTSRVVAYQGGLPGPSQDAGDVVEVPDDEGRRLIQAGQAEAVEERIESAAVAAPQAAVQPRPRTRA